MSPRRIKLFTAFVGLALVLVLAFQLALAELKGAIERSLGPRASVGAVRAGWTGVELVDLRVRGERTGKSPWPAEDELRAARVRVVPDIASLWTEGWRVRRIVVENGYVSALRTREGRLRVVPSLLEQPKAAGDASTGPAPTVRIGEVELADAAVDFFDASVRQPAHRMRLERLALAAGPLVLPALDERVELALDGHFKGPQRDGLIHVSGHVTPSTRDARVAARFTGVDLVALQPYLLRAGETVKKGTLDLQLDAKVARQQLNAPGTVVLAGLELGNGSFAGLPRQAVVAAMSRNDRLQVDFTLEGKLDDPKFSLNEVLAVKLAAALAESLGVSVGGVVTGVGSMLKGLFGK